MRKRIELTPLGPVAGASTILARLFPDYWRATSRRFGLTAYGRTVSEAKTRLFQTTHTERVNRQAATYTEYRARKTPGAGPTGPPTCGFTACLKCHPRVKTHLTLTLFH